MSVRSLSVNHNSTWYRPGVAGAIKVPETGIVFGAPKTMLQTTSIVIVFPLTSVLGGWAEPHEETIVAEYETTSPGFGFAGVSAIVWANRTGAMRTRTAT